MPPYPPPGLRSAHARGPRSALPSSPSDHRALGWALTISGGVLLAVGTALFALDEDASGDPTRPHQPRYFDSAPAALTLAAIGGATAATGLYFLLSSPPLSSPDRPSAASAAPFAAAVMGYAGSF